MGVLHRTFWYMGAKARVLPGFLSRVLEDEVPEGGTVVDLMSGTGIVAAFCADRYRVIANDVEEYAHVVARSLVDHEPATKETFLRSVNPSRDLHRAYERNLSAIASVYAKPLKVEASLLDRFAAGESGETWCRDYRAFLESPGAVYGSNPGVKSRNDLYGAAASQLREETILSYRRDPSKRPAFLVTAYYANVYFGLKQALAIDSLRAAIADLKGDSPTVERKRTHYLSALLHAASVCTSGTSHFAQPRHLKKDSELRAMAARRLKDISARFEECSRDILETVRGTRYLSGNQCFLGDFRSLLDSGSHRTKGRAANGTRFRFPVDVDLIYMDPPYTADNYSRFYHVLNVIARYDDPRSIATPGARSSAVGIRLSSAGSSPDSARSPVWRKSFGG